MWQIHELNTGYVREECQDTCQDASERLNRLSVREQGQVAGEVDTVWTQWTPIILGMTNCWDLVVAVSTPAQVHTPPRPRPLSPRPQSHQPSRTVKGWRRLCSVKSVAAAPVTPPRLHLKCVIAPSAADGSCAPNEGGGVCEIPSAPAAPAPTWSPVLSWRFSHQPASTPLTSPS